MKQLNMSSEDITRTYARCYLGKRVGDKIVPMLVHEGRSSNRFVVTVGNGEETTTLSINDPTIVYEFPASGVYSVKKDKAFYAGRMPARQWRRGIVDKYLNLQGGVRFGYDVVMAMYNPTYYSYAEALAATSKPNTSCALSRNFWINHTGEYENPCIMLRSRIVGEIVNGEPVITNGLISDAFTKEILNAAA